MKNNNEIWVGINDNDPTFLESVNQEFTELPIIDNLSDENALELGSSRRDFLKYLGFGLGAATLAAGCDIPVKRAIPYVTKPDAIVPGVANYYASSFVKGGDYCSVLVKTREGRPIKIEGNALSGVTKGGTSARAQASVLDLYDTNRIQKPSMKDQDGRKVKNTTWEDLDKAIMSGLNENSNIAIVSNTMLSPTAKKVIEDFKVKYPNTDHIIYDAVSSSAMLEANEANFGDKVIPSYHFDKADVIVSLGADFLGTWISPVEYAAQYASGRKLSSVDNAKMSRHIQVESGMSLTGSNADNRILIKPSEQGAAIATLYNEVASLTGGSRVSAPSINPKAANALAVAAKELAANRGKSLVVSGSNNVGEQILINKINDLLGNYGATIDFAEASLQRQGTDQAIQQLISNMNSEQVNAVIVLGDANPVFDLYNGAAFAEAFSKVAMKISTSGMPNETYDLCNYSAPEHNLLESWGDAEPKRGHYSLIQPTISPLFNTRQAEHSLLIWAEAPNLDKTADQPYYEYLKANWQENMFVNQTDFVSPRSFWDATLHGGVFVVPQESVAVTCNADVNNAASKINKPISGDNLEISFYEPVNVGAGQYANNPWLQELPDPVTRTVWGNYVSVPVEWNASQSDFVAFMGIGKDNAKGKAEIVDVDVNGVTNKIIALPQFGQAPGTVSVGLGHGRTVGGLTTKGVGANVNPWLSADANGNTKYYAEVASINIVGMENQFPCVQYHHTMGVNPRGEDGKIVNDPDTGKPFNVDEKALGADGYQGSLTDRSIIFNANLSELKEKTDELHHKREEYNALNRETLYRGYKDEFKLGHHWGMFIDLNACVGCGACSVACMAENNVPVVGKTEVARHHEMTWLRIDRYYYGDVANPSVVYQPMMCQHCDNAPCENVCPVAATNHSAEGLNQMAYNRCIGTRYCANNCPYKVRRFNWLDYTTADIFPVNEYSINGEEMPFGADNLTRMVLNPDVTVRSRGVIEKCSFCVQRIQEGKLTAKREGRSLRDNDVKTACQTACPTGAIVFGDSNNQEGELAKHKKNPLIYRVIEETNTDPSVLYTMKVNNRSEAMDQLS